MEFLKVVLRTCPRVPRDAYAHLGFHMRNGRVIHLVATPRGVEKVVARCDECVFYQLASSGYIFGGVKLSEGRITVIVTGNGAVKKILRNSPQVVKVEEVSYKNLILTEKQRNALLHLAMGKGAGDLAKELGVSRVAALKLIKRALKKVALLV